MNSEVPMAKTARASRYSGRGIEWLRGEERHEKVISSPRPAPEGTLARPQNAARRLGYELSGSGGRRRDRKPPPCLTQDSTWPARYPTGARRSILVSLTPACAAGVVSRST
ncbi:hypothetical protein GCM10010358_24040 [Streptomyces minutiscleroticus]|uniref:Uncharacterized protein n=1 Tax=Streptomyces minutiscleroticus TaxID=68238 RepID=A0A918KQ12_9ACTN|nr:hypothetical protein GCM10010358_24040 [Streptomyces minutiscleroticus]